MHWSFQHNLAFASSPWIFLVIGLLVQHHCYSVSEREQAHSSGWIQQQPQTQQGRGWDYTTDTRSIHRICKNDLYIRTTGNTCSTAQVMFEYPGLSAHGFVAGGRVGGGHG